MSSLQKFHRRTMSSAPAIKAIGSEAPVAGSGWYLGMAGDGTSYMYVAPKSTESKAYAWGPKNTIRGTTSVTNGLANTNTLVSFGTAAHPAAGYCKYLTTGGYNTWYLPSSDELYTLYSNKSATPFATANAFTIIGSAAQHWTSTESMIVGKSGTYARIVNFADGSTYTPGGYKTNTGVYSTRAVRRSTV